MSKKILVTMCVCCMVLGIVTLVSAERPKHPEKVAAEGLSNVPVEHTGPSVKKLDTPIQTKAPKSRVVGTIQYDDGMVGAVPTTSSFTYGNQFNTALGSAVNASGSVTHLQFYMASVAGTGAFVSVFGPVAGATASFLGSYNVPAAPGWNTATVGPANYIGASFLAGVWYFGSDLVGMGTGTTNGQGYHGMMINDIVGTGFAPLSTLNALVRATGDVLVPVELMSFSVE